MRPWPRSAYATVLALLVACGIVLRWEYTHTRYAYRAVGFNDGQIFQQEQTAHKIQQIVPVRECEKFPGHPKATEFLSVKAESIYVIVSDDGSVRFCR